MSIITEKIVLTVELASFVAVTKHAKDELVNQFYLTLHQMGRRHDFLVGIVSWEGGPKVAPVIEPLWEEVKKPKLVRATKNLSLAEYIQEKRLAAGLSQVKLGRVMGMSDSCVSLWESGKAAPIRSNLSKIAKALNCSKNHLNKLWLKEMNDRKLSKGIANEVDQQAQPAADIRERDTAADVQPWQQRDIRHGDSFATANSSITTTTF
jgi:transcriptional regulator with XRE-family HTH domain